MAVTRTRLPAVLDRELEAGAVDAFGHQLFASALTSLIADPGNEPPFSIGLLGRWGTGKSTIKAMATRDLKADPFRGHKHQVVTFNAWRYGNQDLRRAFLRDIFIQLGGNEDDLDAQLRQQQQRHEEVRRSSKAYWSDFFGRVGMILLFVAVAGALAYGLALLLSRFFPNFETSVKQAVVSALFSGAVIAAVMKELQVNRWTSVTHTIPPKKDAEE